MLDVQQSNRYFTHKCAEKCLASAEVTHQVAKDSSISLKSGQKSKLNSSQLPQLHIYVPIKTPLLQFY